jgi:serine phosphatase RsbU (regulator of sigma subunit)/ligand-binding sensor domain-containing protein
MIHVGFSLRGRVTRLSCLLALCAALHPSLQAQTGVLFDHVTVRQGLSQGTVNCILQDAQGFMWLGTQDGLNRFDGYDMKVFKHDPADPKTLNDNFIVFLGEDSSRTLWIGTLKNPKTLNRYDRRTESFTEVPRESVAVAGLRIGASHPEYVDPAGVRYGGTIGGGVTRTDPRTGKVEVFRHEQGNAATLADDRVFSVVGDRNGGVWIGTRDGLDRFDPRSGVFTHYRHDEKNPRSLSDNWVWPILEDHQGNIWVGTFNGGLNRFDRGTDSFTRFRHDETNPRSLAGDRLYSLAEDRSGMIWVGMGDNGVDRFHPDMAAFRHLRHEPRDAASLADDNITAMFVTSTGTAWVGTRGGLDRWDRPAGQFVHYGKVVPKGGSPGGLIAQSFAEDHSGGLWVGTLSDGLYRWNQSTGTFTVFKHDPANPRSVSDNRIYSLCEDRSGTLWVGTYRAGLNRLDKATGAFTRFQHSDSLPGSLGGPGVWSLLEDREGTLWVGTLGGGLDRFDRESGTFTHFRHDDANPKSISDDIILCITEDRAGVLWIGTTGGLNRLDRASGTFQSYREKDDLANDMVFGIMEDGQGNLWMSTNKGISKLDPRRESFRTYTYADGLQGDEFNQGAAARDPRTGEILFGGANGFTVFQPDQVKDNPYVPPIVFSAFSRYNTDDAEGRPIQEKGIDAAERIILSYKDNVANFEFAALSYYNNDKNQYSYKLDGYSDNWIRLGTERRATFTNLDGGEYTLRVRASNNDGIWNDDGAALSLTVTPPWWKTKLAYACYALAFFGLLYVLRRFEINRREQKARVRESELRAKAVESEKRALQAENDRQTKELEDARQLQLSMLPRDIPRLPEYDIAVSMKTATEVGGDYYDFTVGPDGTLNVGFGDATGHGMQAGTIVTLMKGLFLSDAARLDIRSFFQRCSLTMKEIRLGRLFMAFNLVRLKENAVSFSSAGMPPAFLYRNATGEMEEIFLKGMPLGAMKNFPYALHEMSMERGDTLLFLTDGLPEQKNASGEMFDYARVQNAFAASIAGTPEEIIAGLVSAGEEWMTGVTQDDDITLLVIRKKF